MADPTIGDALIVEYERLKDEQKHRIAARDGLLYATFAATAGVIIGVLRFGGGASLLLVLPAVTVVLGWTYLVNDQKVSAIGRYVRTRLAPRLQAIVGAPVFEWELVHRVDTRRHSRKILQATVNLAVFTAGPLVALTIYWVTGPWPVGLLAISAVEAIATLTLAGQILRYADMAVHKPQPGHPQGTVSQGGREL